jgi:hypothetical protein
METKNQLSQLVRQLIEAENVAGTEDRQAVNSILSRGFLGMRASKPKSLSDRSVSCEEICHRSGY